MALKSVPGYYAKSYVPAGFNAKQIRAYNSAPKAKPFGAMVADPKAYAPTITSTPGYMGPAADQPGYIPPGGSGYTPPGGGGGGAGAGGGVVTPSFQMQIEGDPLYQNAINAFESATGAGRASLREQIRNAIIQSGYGNIGSQMTGDLADYAGDLDPATLATAAQNPLSGRAQLQKSLDQGQRNLLYQLAGRGVLRSGELEVGNTGMQEQYDVASNAQQQALLTALRGGVGQYRDLLGTQTSNRNAALEAIAARLAQGQGPIPGDETSAGGTTTTTTTDDGLYPTVDVSGAKLPVTVKPKSKPVVQPAAMSKPSANSPYYYGGGGYQPTPPPKKKKKG